MSWWTDVKDAVESRVIQPAERAVDKVEAFVFSKHSPEKVPEVGDPAVFVAPDDAKVHKAQKKKGHTLGKSAQSAPLTPAKPKQNPKSSIGTSQTPADVHPGISKKALLAVGLVAAFVLLRRKGK